MRKVSLGQIDRCSGPLSLWSCFTAQRTTSWASRRCSSGSCTAGRFTRPNQTRPHIVFHSVLPQLSKSQALQRQAKTQCYCRTNCVEIVFSAEQFQKKAESRLWFKVFATAALVGVLLMILMIPMNKFSR